MRLMTIKRPEAIDKTGGTSDVDSVFAFRFSSYFVKEATHVYCQAFDDFWLTAKRRGSAQGIVHLAEL